MSVSAFLCYVHYAPVSIKGAVLDRNVTAKFFFLSVQYQ